jgi:hypothetical protein
MIAAILKRSLAARDAIGRHGALVPDIRTCLARPPGNRIHDFIEKLETTRF